MGYGHWVGMRRPLSRNHVLYFFCFNPFAGIDISGKNVGRKPKKRRQSQPCTPTTTKHPLNIQPLIIVFNLYLCVLVFPSILFIWSKHYVELWFYLSLHVYLSCICICIYVMIFLVLVVALKSTIRILNTIYMVSPYCNQSRYLPPVWIAGLRPTWLDVAIVTVTWGML